LNHLEVADFGVLFQRCHGWPNVRLTSAPRNRRR
jgi:hypothetical protein